jgi:sortase (surface protein transpeptidase)
MLSPMKILRSLAIFSFLAGVGLLIFGFAFAGDSTPKPAVVDTPARLEATATNTPTPAPTDAPTATPTPKPFDGKVAKMKIPRFKVDSAIEEIGLKSNNELDTPHNPLNTGWYNIYDKPGFGGNSVFSAHVDYYPNILGPFNKLKDSELGDDILVTMENGLEYRYKVIRRERYSVDTIPMGDLIWPKDKKPADKEWITLITCGGEFVPSRPGGPGEYLQRDVVVAERVQ